MKEIKIDEYIRLDNGEIGKVIDIKENPKRVVYSEYGEIALRSSILKHSEDLIDLIEVGDIVNGFPVLEPIYNGNVIYGIDEGYENFKKSFGDIKTILTKEQFEANCYKVEGEEDETSND